MRREAGRKVHPGAGMTIKGGKTQRIRRSKYRLNHGRKVCENFREKRTRVR